MFVAVLIFAFLIRVAIGIPAGKMAIERITAGILLFLRGVMGEFARFAIVIKGFILTNPLTVNAFAPLINSAILKVGL